MRLHISHTTHFDYDEDVQPGPHLLYLRPRDNPLLRVEHFQVHSDPGATVHWLRDEFDNMPASMVFAEAASAIDVHSTCQVTTAEEESFAPWVRDYARTFPFTYEPLHHFNLGLYLTPPNEPTQRALKKWLEGHFTLQPSGTVEWLSGLNRVLFETLRYGRRSEPGIQDPLATLQLGTGSCRDYAVLQIAIARTMGLAARFVSGYLFDPLLDDSAAGDMHAWVEVYVPGAGWRALDPTHGIFCHDGYIPVAHAIVAESVSPVQGSFLGPRTVRAQLTTRVKVLRIDPQ